MKNPYKNVSEQGMERLAEIDEYRNNLLGLMRAYRQVDNFDALMDAHDILDALECEEIDIMDGYDCPDE